MDASSTVSVTEIVGLFNILVGLMFVGAITTFIGGIISYIISFNNLERSGGVELMKWGVAILFVLDVLLGFAQFIQGHGGVGNILVALIVIVGAVWVAIMAFNEASVSKKEEKKP